MGELTRGIPSAILSNVQSVTERYRDANFPFESVFVVPNKITEQLQRPSSSSASSWCEGIEMGKLQFHCERWKLVATKYLLTGNKH